MTVHPTRPDQKVRRLSDGRVGTVVRVAGMQDPRVFASPKRLLVIQWDDTAGKQDVWSDLLEVSA